MLRNFASLLLCAACLAQAPGDSLAVPGLQLWYGCHQQAGRAGRGQPAFNLLGSLRPSAGRSLAYSVNGGPLRALSIGAGEDGFGDGRRLARSGDFNADIPFDSLRLGLNTVELVCSDSTRQSLQVELHEGDGSLPRRIDWQQADLQALGQVVDGHWRVEDGWLRLLESGYDRLFLIGEPAWQDYEVETSLRVLVVEEQTGPHSGSPGVGVMLRFEGHRSGSFRNYPEAQPLWGYLPFGMLGWLRWVRGTEEKAELQAMRGDMDIHRGFALRRIELGTCYGIRMRCQTLPPDAEGNDGTRYSFKLWPADEPEPDAWSWQWDQFSSRALRSGGLALVAHHVEAAFGPVEVQPLKPLLADEP